MWNDGPISNEWGINRNTGIPNMHTPIHRTYIHVTLLLEYMLLLLKQQLSYNKNQLVRVFQTPLHFSLNLYTHLRMLSELLPEEKRKIHELEQKISELESGSTSRFSYSDLAFEYEQLSTRISGLEKLLSKEPRSKVDDYRRRLAHLKSSAQHVKQSLDNLGKKHNYYSNLLKQKAELMGNAQGGRDDIALEMAENGSLSRSSQMIGEYIALGRESLGELSSQKERLKAVQRRVLDMFNYLGLSNTLMKGIENRENVDKLIVYGGMVIVLIILIVVYMYFRK